MADTGGWVVRGSWCETAATQLESLNIPGSLLLQAGGWLQVLSPAAAAFVLSSPTPLPFSLFLLPEEQIGPSVVSLRLVGPWQGCLCSHSLDVHLC